MCSITCVKPASSSSSSFDPVLIKTPIDADETFESLFKTLKISYKRVNINKAKKIVKCGENYPDINEIMSRVKANVGYEKRLPFVPIG